MDHKLDIQIEAMKLQLERDKATLRKYESVREADIIAAHTFTAADFRLRIYEDSNCWNLDDIVGDEPTEDDTDEFRANYEEWKAAYENGDVYCNGFILERRNPATEEWDEIDSCGGFLNKGHVILEQLLDDMRENIDLPEGIKLADIEIISE